MSRYVKSFLNIKEINNRKYVIYEIFSIELFQKGAVINHYEAYTVDDKFIASADTLKELISDLENIE